jgi:hypothetical protein
MARYCRLIGQLGQGGGLHQAEFIYDPLSFQSPPLISFFLFSEKRSIADTI